MGTEPHRFFPPFRLDPVNGQLWRRDQEIKLRRKTFDVLLYLVNRPGQLVSKATLLDAIGPRSRSATRRPRVVSRSYARRWATNRGFRDSLRPCMAAATAS